jgi:DNA-binding XRE family transcriptional regulator
MTREELKKLREKHNITQEQLAKDIGVDHKQTVNRWEATGKISKVYKKLLTEYFKKLKT